MIFGSVAKTLALSVLLVGVTPSVGDDERVVETLAAIQVERNVRVPFRETRSSPMLSEPLKLSGFVRFDDDGSFSKTITDPLQESIRIGRGKLEYRSSGKQRRVALQRRQGLEDFYRGFRALLEGDPDTLLTFFDAAGQFTGEHWTIVLSAKLPELVDFAERIVVTGRGEAITTIRTEQTEAAWQLMSFPPATQD